MTFTRAIGRKADATRASRPAVFGGRRGFTLVELMVVIVLIAIMSAVIIPEMRGSYQDSVLRSASRSLIDGFDLASSRAVSFNQTHRLHLDRRDHRYVIERKLREGGSDKLFVPLKDISGATGKWDPSVTVEFRPGGGESSPDDDAGAAPAEPIGAREAQPAEAITFYPDGTADSGEVLLEDRGGFRLVLRMNPVTARIHIVEKPPK